MTTPNVPRHIAVVVPRYATLHELDTVYGTEDLYDMVEMAAVEAHNRAEAARHAAAQRAIR